MTNLDYIETWWLSVQPLLEAHGVTGRFQRSSIERPNPSCSLNLRRGELEADLLTWETGEAELSTIEPDGSIKQQHLENIHDRITLGIVLSRLSAMAYTTGE